MTKRSSRNTKGRIVAAAWKLFYEQGYEETTVEDIIFESETSKGSFYHYFDGKDALLSSLSVLFDERYEELMQQPHDEMDCIALLCWLNQELFTTIENTVSIELLARLFPPSSSPRVKSTCSTASVPITGSCVRSSRRGRSAASSRTPIPSARSSRPTRCSSAD